MNGGSIMLTMQENITPIFTPAIQAKPFSEIKHILPNFRTVALDEMQAYTLQDRVDTKYLIRLVDLPALLGRLVPTSRVLEVEDQRINTYRTLYFDTPELSFYHDHHNGKRPRLKVRMRTYLSNGQTFLEIKRKENLLRTSKQRMAITEVSPAMTPRMFDFLREHGVNSGQRLKAMLWNRFQRITLISNATCERMTIDLGIAFHDHTSMLQLPHLAVVELKQINFSRDSIIMQSMKEKGYQPVAFSKYCNGIATLNPTVKRNRFKQTFLQFNASTKRTFVNVNLDPVRA
jgi:hypothetical protein